MRERRAWRSAPVDFLLSVPPCAQFFSEITQKFKHLDCVRQQRLRSRGRIAHEYAVCVLLHNMRACIVQTSWAVSYFKCALPSLEEYLSILD